MKKGEKVSTPSKLPPLTPPKLSSSKLPSKLPPLTASTPSKLPPLTASTPSKLPSLTASTPSKLPPLTASTPSKLPPLTTSTPSKLPPLTSTKTPSKLSPSKTFLETSERVKLTGVKDTDQLIFSKLSDKDLLSLCLTNKSVNKMCKDEIFWRNRFVERFENSDIIIKYKDPKKSWRNFYLKFISHLDKYNNTIDLLKHAIHIEDPGLFVYAYGKSKDKIPVKLYIDIRNLLTEKYDKIHFMERFFVDNERNNKNSFLYKYYH
jgi:hypothetical protein